MYRSLFPVALKMRRRGQGERNSKENVFVFLPGTNRCNTWKYCEFVKESPCSLICVLQRIHIYTHAHTHTCAHMHTHTYLLINTFVHL